MITITSIIVTLPIVIIFLIIAIKKGWGDGDITDLDL